MKICFWGDIASALNGNTMGGGELQLALLAKALVKGGHEVVILDSDTPKDFITTDGIKVTKIKGWNAGIPFIRSFTHRLPKLYNSLKAQQADIYYCRIRDFRHILAFWAARKVKAKFILGIASDLDVSNFSSRIKYFYLVNRLSLWVMFNGFLTEIIYPLLLRKADLVLVQHTGQRDILLQKGIKSQVFPNLFEQIEIQSKQNHLTNHFVYVGSLDKRKGFVEFCELVKNAPFHRFKVIGSPRDKTAFRIYEKLKKFRNVTLMGKLTQPETVQHIANSKALISTSPMEGFPNVFIEAWACGIPVLSLYIDPGDIIKREKLGFAADGDMDKMVKAIDGIGNQNGLDKRAKTYVKEFHTLTENKIAEISSLFYELKENRINI